MAPKKNKGGNNGFFYFLMDLRKKMDVGKANAEAAQLWPKLSVEDKNYYKQLAGKSRETSKAMTTLNEDVDQLQKEQQRLANEEDYMKKDINKMIRHLKASNQLTEANFYFINFNVFCCTNNNDYYPAEVGLLRFNFKSGVTDENIYHSFIKHRELPVGYAAKIKTTADLSHQIPYQKLMGEGPGEVITEIFNFLEEDEINGTLPAVFVVDELREMTTEILRQMASNYGYQPEKIRVYSLTYLFFLIRNNITTEVWPTISQSVTELSHDPNEYTHEIACEFHQLAEAVSFCCRSRVIRWVFKFCDNCCTDMNIKMIPGRHVPQSANVNVMNERCASENTFYTANSEIKDEFGAASSSSRGVDSDEWKTVNPGLRRPHVNYNQLGLGRAAIRNIAKGRGLNRQ